MFNLLIVSFGVLAVNAVVLPRQNTTLDNLFASLPQHDSDPASRAAAINVRFVAANSYNVSVSRREHS